MNTFRFDHVYYKKKYSIDMDDKISIKKHYEKVGKNKGYFACRKEEMYYISSLNFDPVYYKRKYNVDGDNNTVKREWETNGFKKGHYPNKCTEDNGHDPLMCVCIIKNGTMKSMYNVNNSKRRRTAPILETDHNNYVFSDTESQHHNARNIHNTNNIHSVNNAVNTKNANDKYETEMYFTAYNSETFDDIDTSESESIIHIIKNDTKKMKEEDIFASSSECTASVDLKILNKDIRKSNVIGVNRKAYREDNNEVSIGTKSTNMNNVITAHDKEYTEKNQHKFKTNKKINQKTSTKSPNKLRRNLRKDVINKPNIPQRNTRYNNINSTKQKVHSNPTRPLRRNGTYIDTRIQRDNIVKTLGNIGHMRSANKRADVVSYIPTVDTVPIKSVKPSTNIVNNVNTAKPVKEIEDLTLSIEYDSYEYSCSCSDCKPNNNTKHRDECSTKSSDSKSRCSTCDMTLITDDNVTTDTESNNSANSVIHIQSVSDIKFNENIDRILFNIEYIREYLSVTDKYIEQLLSYVKDIFIVFTGMCKGINSIEYITCKNRIKTYVTEMNRIISNAMYDNVPIFKGESCTIVKFPVIDFKDKEYMMNILNEKEFFTMQLPDMSLEKMKIINYTKRPVNETEVIGPDSNPLPYKPPVATEKRKRPDYIFYHVNRFEKAFTRIVTIKESLIDCSQTLLHRIEHIGSFRKS